MSDDISRIRAEMAWWGADLAGLTDEEVTAGVRRVGEALAAATPSAAEAAANLAANCDLIRSALAGDADA